MRPTFSEFSYGFCVTDELIHWAGTTLTAAPIFPSLFSEGQAGGGWDVMLQRPSIPLFLQFKLSHKMVRRSAQEIVSGHLKTTPFFRMHIWSRAKSRQQELLMDLEDAGEQVYYVAPAFFSDTELNSAYLNHMVNARSIFVRPSLIGRLTDNEEHWVAFDTTLTPFVCSVPKRSNQKVDFDSFSLRVLKRVVRSPNTLSIKRASQLLDTVLSVAMKDPSVDRKLFQQIQSASEQRITTLGNNVVLVLQQVAYIARTFLGCELLVVSNKS